MAQDDDLSEFSLFEIFKVETEACVKTLTENLLDIENNPDDTTITESLMRAAHSIKGAAKIVGLDILVTLAHIMEDCFVAVQNNIIQLNKNSIDVMLQAVDFFPKILDIKEAEIPDWSEKNFDRVNELVSNLELVKKNKKVSISKENLKKNSQQTQIPSDKTDTEGFDKQRIGKSESKSKTYDRQENDTSELNISQSSPQKDIHKNVETENSFLRINAHNINNILSLSSDFMIETKWLDSFKNSLFNLKKKQKKLNDLFDDFIYTYKATKDSSNNDSLARQVNDIRTNLASCGDMINGDLLEIDEYSRRTIRLSHFLYYEVLNCRMRPFADAVQGFPRLVRDLAHSLNKDIKFNIIGEKTPIDRDILQKIESPLNHLLRNALDHGIELTDIRHANGKKPKGEITLEAQHVSGLLLITITDDGHGIDIERIRKSIIKKQMIAANLAENLSNAEILEFLFLPGFSLRETVSEISGRGVGLDIVKSEIKSINGSLRVQTELGIGTTFHIELPITLSVIRALLVDINHEPYAFPINQINKTISLSYNQVHSVEGKQFFIMDGKQIGLVIASQVLGLSSQTMNDYEELSIVVISDTNSNYGIVVDNFIGESQLVVKPLDNRLGKLMNVSAGAISSEGNPVIIFDVEDLFRSIENLISGNNVSRITSSKEQIIKKNSTKILVVDDSITVRELEKKILTNHGFEVDTAVNGVDAWNMVRTGNYELVISDIDMPRMDGIELVSHIKNDPHLKNLPVMIVSYKDRDEDRRRGMEVGADYYLVKSSFHDENMIEAVFDLIGKP